MQAATVDFRVREAVAGDASALCRILNDIIVIGGTTSLETRLSVTAFGEVFLTGRDYIVCFVAESLAGDALGFQSLTRNSKLPEGWGDIATFTQQEPRLPGVGTALFKRTVDFSRQSGLIAINATIRADNYCGIPFYEKMGFRTYSTAAAVLLQSGVKIDRVSKYFPLK